MVKSTRPFIWDTILYLIYSIIFSSINGDQWKLSNGAKLHDVTHLPCRSARYQPLDESASPANVNSSEFPVIPGSLMPAVEGCKKQDYWVVFVIALESRMVQ